jgi:hypothetical protein
LPRLGNHPGKRLARVGEKTHTLMPGKNRMELIGAVQGLFAEDGAC